METTESTTAEPHRDRFIQVIAVFKFLKTILFILAALGAFGLLQQSIAEQARVWGSELAFTSGQRLVRRVVMLLTSLSRSRIRALGLIALFYAALFATEGVGLWREKRWAEYLTVVATASLVPFEIWEIAHRPSLIKVAVLVGNVVIVAYLIYRLRRPRLARDAFTMPNATPAREPEQSRVG